MFYSKFTFCFKQLKKVKNNFIFLDDAMSCGRWHVCPLVVLTFQCTSGLGNVKSPGRTSKLVSTPNYCEKHQVQACFWLIKDESISVFRELMIFSHNNKIINHQLSIVNYLDYFCRLK